MRIAFANLADSGWTAGGQYLKNLFAAIRLLDESLRPEIALLTVQGTPANVYGFLNPYIDRQVSIPDSKWLRYWKSAYLRFPIPVWAEMWLVSRRATISRLCENQVEVLFSNDEYGPGFPIPLLSWIPDFQHSYLPELFSVSKIKTRNRHNLRIAEFADRVILSSQSVLGDFVKFAPQKVKKARVVHFVAQLPEGVYDSDPAWVCDHYHLPKRFVYLPNQFWKHKNHPVVAEALTLLIERHPEIVVVCTGKASEFREPGYFAQLVDTLRQRHLEENMLLLGMVPHDHIFQLMRQSLAVVQPSLFEGWSTIVEEAKSLGKGMIVSDIPVHREQDPPCSVFFDPHDPRVLAEILVRVFDEKIPGPDLELEAIARENLPQRTRGFGETFLKVAKEVVLS